jgi:hypothetical protein
VLHRVALLAALSCLLGCNQRVDGGAADGEFLRLEGFSLVVPADGRLRGFVRWMFTDQDPSSVADPAATCEIWEELDLYVVSVEDSCPDCDYQFEGTATVEDSASTTCEDVSWARRSFTLAWGALTAGDPALAALADDGYTHAVHTRWSPELGESEGFQTLFAARPMEWEPDEPGGAGSGPNEVLQGQHELTGLYYWEL